MSQLVDVRAIVRRQVMERVVRCLIDAGIPRLTVSKGTPSGGGRRRSALR
jgi:nitrogen regulatory protein PII